MLIDFRTFRDTFFHPIQFSAPHIYLSALLFASPTSMVSKLFLPNFPSLPVVQRSIDHTHSEHSILQFEGHNGFINCVTFSPDGKLIVSGSSDCTIRVWNIENSEAASLLFEGHEAEVLSIAVSPNGRYIASRAMDDTIRLWDIATCTSILKWVVEGTLNPCNTSILTPDGKYIISASRYIQFLNIESSEMKLKPFQPDEAFKSDFEPLCAAFSVDGQYIAFGTLNDQSQPQVQNIETGKLKASFVLGERWDDVEVLSFSPDGKYMVAGSLSRQIQLWNIETGDKVFSKPIILEDHIKFVGFSPDGKYIVSSTGGHRNFTIQLWNAKTGVVASKPFQGHTLAVNCASLSPNGKDIVTGSLDGTIQLWNIEMLASQADEVALRPLMSKSHAVQSSIVASFSPDGKYIACGSHNHPIQLWDVKTGEAALGLFVGHTNRIISVLFSPDGKYIASDSWDKTIRLWNAKNGEVEFTLFVPTVSISFSPDGNYIASSSGSDIRLWNVKTAEPAFKPFRNENARPWFTSISFSPDGNHIIAAASFGNEFEVWNIKTGAKAASFNENEDIRITCVAFSPDGQYIAGGYDRQARRVYRVSTEPPRGIRVWNAKTGEVATKLDLSNTEFQTFEFVAFSPDGKYILISSASAWTIWQAWTTIENDILPTPMPFQLHQRIIDSVSFSPNGKYIAYGSDGTIRIYNND